MRSNFAGRVKASWGRIRSFFSDEIWEKRLDTLPPWQAFRYRSARILYCTLRGLIFEETLHVRATALTYFTVLSLVPLLAFAFALLFVQGISELIKRIAIICGDLPDDKLDAGHHAGHLEVKAVAGDPDADQKR